MADVPEAVLEALAAAAGDEIGAIAARVPPDVAAELGRLGAGAGWAAGPHSRPAAAGGAVTARAGVRVRPAESALLAAVRGIAPERAGQLLGALEPTVTALAAGSRPDLSSCLAPPPDGRVSFVSSNRDGQLVTAVSLLERVRPGAGDLVATLTRRLAGHQGVVPLLAVPVTAADEAAVAAAHGAAYLALALVVANAVIGGWRPPPVLVSSPAATVVGAAAGVAVTLLRAAPMPPGYPAARLEKARDEYRLPRQLHGSVTVTGHQFALAEDPVTGQADFGGNGLVAVVAGGVVVRTGAADTPVRVHVRVAGQEPPLDAPGMLHPRRWDEVVEVSWRAARGLASVSGAGEPDNPRLREVTPPWPGDYRARVYATGRDDGGQDEEYQLVVWAAPAAAEVVHKRTDLTGYRLRGEPAPSRPEPPERAYRWVRDSALDLAATVTVVTGCAVGEVLLAFGADPRRPESLRRLASDAVTTGSLVPWVAVLDTGTAVLAVEYNGFEGSKREVLRRASGRGRAASMFWNVNAMTRLAFAEDGRVLADFEPPGDVDGGPAVAAALDGLDFDDYRNTAGRGLVAVQRFTGRGLTEAGLRAIEAADVAFRVTPRP